MVGGSGDVLGVEDRPIKGGGGVWLVPVPTPAPAPAAVADDDDDEAGGTAPP